MPAFVAVNAGIESTLVDSAQHFPVVGLTVRSHFLRVF